MKAFVVHADSYIGKNVALWLQEHKHEVVGTLGYDPGVKKPYYLTEAFHVPPVKTLKAHSLERPRSRHVRRMVRAPQPDTHMCGAGLPLRCEKTAVSHTAHGLQNRHGEFTLGP